MSYLIIQDFKKLIQTDNLQQIIGGDNNVLTSTQLTAQAEAISYLIQKYDTTQEFTDTNVWDIAVIYKAKARVYLDAPAYVPATSYVINDLTLQGGVVYKCTANTTGTFDPTKWVAIGVQYAMFYGATPYPEFNLKGYYKTGDIVFWKDKTYTCKIATTAIGHEGQLQYGQYANIPYSNIFPDDAVNGNQYWGAGVSYSVAAGTLPTDISKWVLGDNRSQQLVQHVIDIALYHVHSRIAPRNIPELRVKRYDDAIKWLRMAGKGDITPNLPLIQPLQGNRIRYGGAVKNINTY